MSQVVAQKNKHTQVFLSVSYRSYGMLLDTSQSEYARWLKQADMLAFGEHDPMTRGEDTHILLGA